MTYYIFVYICQLMVEGCKTNKFTKSLISMYMAMIQSLGTLGTRK